MNMRTTILIGATVMLSAMLATAAAHPGQRGDRAGHSSERGHFAQRIERLADQLNLSDSQLTQIQAVAEQARANEATELREAIQANRDALRAASEYSQYDAATVAALANEKGALVAQRIELRAQTKHDVLAVLTAEQRAELEVLKVERETRRAERRARRAERRAARNNG